MNIEIVNKIGYYGPLLLIIITFYNLLDQKKYLFSYLIFYIANTISNKLLKIIIKQPRPSGYKEIINENHKDADVYGMPSGHAQSSLFSITFLYLVKGRSPWTIIELVIAFLTLYHRFKFKQHSIEQLIAGSIIGSIIAYISYSLTTNYLKGKLDFSITNNI